MHVSTHACEYIYNACEYTCILTMPPPTHLHLHLQTHTHTHTHTHSNSTPFPPPTHTSAATANDPNTPLTAANTFPPHKCSNVSSLGHTYTSAASLPCCHARPARKRIKPAIYKVMHTHAPLALLSSAMLLCVEGGVCVEKGCVEGVCVGGGGLRVWV